MKSVVSLEALAALYEQLGTGRPETDRRKHPRVRTAGHLMASIVRVDGSVEAKVWDLSRSGMAVVSGQRMKPGERVVAEFSLAGRPVRATCRVANCRRDEKVYVIGLEFERVERPASGELPGVMLDAGEVMLGAEANHVKGVTERLREAMRG